MTHQELFDDWVKARISVIWENSSTISKDIRLLFDKASAYAKENGLHCDKEIFETFDPDGAYGA